MSAAVLVSAAAGALAGGAMAELAPDAGPVARRLVHRARGRMQTPGRLDPIVPAGGVLALVLLIAGAAAPALVVGLGPVIARGIVEHRRARRRRAVGLGAPLVARAVADALDAGHGVRRAIGEASRASGLGGPAAEELRRVAARLEAGDPLAGSLDAWRVRTDEPAHRTLVAGLLLHGEAGGELADVLRDQAAALERARRATAEAESAIVQSRAAARIVGGLPAVVMVGAVALAPATVSRITGNPLGAFLVVVAVLLQVAAVVAVRRLTAGLTR